MSQLSNAHITSLSRGAPSSAPPSRSGGVVARPDGLPLRGSGEARAPEAVAGRVYAELRAAGYSEQQVIAVAGELLSLVTAEVRSQSSG